jgi:hypothetical protein
MGSNNFCCPKGTIQPCCLPSACLCSVLSPCVPFAPTPDRCLLDADQYPIGIDHALCMTQSTLDDEPAFWTTDGVRDALTFVDNFTIAFWARAREALNFSELPSTGGVTFEPRGSLFMPLLDSGNSFQTIGLYLGIDGFSIQQWSIPASSIVVQRQPLIGWHHYAIVCDNREMFVFIDGASRESSMNRALNIVSEMVFRPGFGRARARYTINFGPSIIDRAGTGFEGWISELRLVNRTMLGGEALAQMNNLSAWNYSYSMNGCSGENHNGTDIERFDLQQAWLVCGEPLPTCGVGGGGFMTDDLAGCLCEDNATLSRKCVNGVAAENDSIVVQPLALWHLYDVKSDGTVPDSSGSGLGRDGVVILGSLVVGAGSKFASFNNTIVDVGVDDAFNFGVRNFSIEFRLRTTSKTAMAVLSKDAASCPSSGSFFLVLINFGGTDGDVFFQFGTGASYSFVSTNGVNVTDGVWHGVWILRRGVLVQIFVDGMPYGAAMTDGIANFSNEESLFIGVLGPAAACGSLPFYGDLADVSIYVDVNTPPPHLLCTSESASSQLGNCWNFVGFCWPTQQQKGRHCCGASGCLECSSYHTCSANATTVSVTTMLTTSTATRTTTVDVNVNASVFTSPASKPMTLTPTAVAMISDGGFSTTIWIVIVVVAAAICLIIGLLLACLIQRRTRRNKDASNALRNVNGNVKEDEDMSSAIYGIRGFVIVVDGS